ncbi:hypothetical protein [uncultured Paludibaculum sp.]|uniref:hypothetical protein n=1 Tax=uncultured Paludibaculum sp. TaxID=1765020 RepID=UPI002AABB33A|nr:hypothetical protein [uncultured Paludibaculum sp.]
MKLLALLCFSLVAFAQDAPQLFYSKKFPGSKPEYQEIRLNRDGKAEYREGPEEDNPIILKLKPAETDTVFELSDKLGHFDHEVESGLKVARMGDKLLRWQKSSESHEVKFNYSADPDTQAIYDWFERMCESAQLFIDLERTARYDKLGVNQSILKLEAAWDRRRIVGLDVYLPLLDRIAKNETYLNMARERAERLAATFRNPPPPPKPAGEAKSQ